MTRKMNFIILILAVCCSQLVYSQPKLFSTANIKNLEIKALICIDSIGRKTSLCPLYLDGFDVEIYKAFFDKKTKELRLIGRLSSAIAYVGIFLGSNDTIPLKAPISRTSYDKEYLNNDGFFDVSFIINKNTILYFYERKYFARQFNIFKLLDQK